MTKENTNKEEQDIFKTTTCPDCNGTGEIQLNTDHEEWKDCETCNSTFPQA